MPYFLEVTRIKVVRGKDEYEVMRAANKLIEQGGWQPLGGIVPAIVVGCMITLGMPKQQAASTPDVSKPVPVVQGVVA